MASQQEKAFCVLRFELRLALPAVLSRARNSRCTAITDLDTSKRSTQNASELLVAHEKLGQLPLLTVYVLPV
jgi:hypothetical protein